MYIQLEEGYGGLGTTLKTSVKMKNGSLSQFRASYTRILSRY